MAEQEKRSKPGDASWLKRKMDACDGDEGCISVGGLAIKAGATFDEKGSITIGKGHPVDLVIDIPRLGLKSGTRAKVTSVKGPELYEISAWSDLKDEVVSVVVERNWIIAVLPREAAQPE